MQPLFVLVDDGLRDFTIGGPGDDLILAPPAGEGESPGSAVVVDETLPAIAELTDFGLGVLNSNPLDTNDVNGDGVASPLDVLQIINDLNRRGPRPPDSEVTQAGCELGATTAAWDENHTCIDVDAMYFPDTNSDGTISPVDVLRVINHLNRKLTIAEGEIAFRAKAQANTEGSLSTSDLQRFYGGADSLPAVPDPGLARTADLPALSFAKHGVSRGASSNPSTDSLALDAADELVWEVSEDSLEATSDVRERVFEDIAKHREMPLLDALVDEFATLRRST